MPDHSTTLPRVATREYWNTKQPVPLGYGAYAYLVFTSDPRSTQKERYQEICAAFNGYLPPTMQSHSAAERMAQMVTFWPISSDLVTNEPDCQQLIATYDRVFAARVAASIGNQGARGPLLVAWSKPYGEANSQALVLDMSSFANADLARAIRTWKNRIAMNPAIWQRGWNAVLVKAEIRNVIENIAPSVVTVIAAFFPKSKPE